VGAEPRRIGRRAYVNRSNGRLRAALSLKSKSQP
jgi:hypothetical protein